MATAQNGNNIARTVGTLVGIGTGLILFFITLGSLLFACKATESKAAGNEAAIAELKADVQADIGDIKDDMRELKSDIKELLQRTAP